MNIAFITGTDTGIGKTTVSAWLCMHAHHTFSGRVHYWKPIQSGLDDGTDSEALLRLAPGTVIHPETHRLTQPLSPHASALIDGVTIELKKLVQDFRAIQAQLSENDVLLIEGAGGLLVPLNAQHSIVDLIAQLQVPVLLVARSTLGTINHTRLSLECLRHRKLDVLGVVTSGPDHPDNLSAIEYYGGCPVLAHLPWMPTVTQSALRAHPVPGMLFQMLAPVLDDEE